MGKLFCYGILPFLVFTLAKAISQMVGHNTAIEAVLFLCLKHGISSPS